MTECWPRLDRRIWSGVTAKMLASVKRPDAGSLYDRTLAGCVWSVLTYADMRCTEEMLSDWTLGVSGRAIHVWNLTGNDRTLRSYVRSLSN